ncbi:MAG: UvrD-helicase domain-containing protein, partial [Nakamurella sp.]
RISATQLADRLALPPPTDEQRAVIESPLGPSLVVAGAGSGKTETMAARVVYLVANGLVLPEQVLGLTFTRKAAGQLAERIRSRLRALARTDGVAADIAQALAGAEPEVSTYHAFAGRLIGEYGPLVGIEPSSRVLTPTSCWQLARRLVGRWEDDLDTDQSPDQVTETLLALSGGLADHLRRPDELAGFLDTLIGQLDAAPPSKAQKGAVHSGLAGHLKNLRQRCWVLPLVNAFAEAKRAAGAVDFSDQMQLAARLVTAHPAIGGSLRQKYRVVLLDEYQDTGHAQRVILRTLFGSSDSPGPPGSAVGKAVGHPVTAVGDPVQSIYTWRGASTSNLRRFATDFPQPDGTPAPRLTLLTSFRNPPQVLELANALSESVRRDVDGLRARPGAIAGSVRYALLPTIGQENRWLAEQLAQHWQAAVDAGRPPPPIAVLMRRRREMADLAEVLRDKGLPVEVVGLGGLLDEPEVADLVAMLHLLVDPNSGASALRILTGARWQLGGADLAALAGRAQQLAGRRRQSAAGDPTESVRAALSEAACGAEEAEDIPSLVDAIADPGDAALYSAAGHRRISRLATELQLLRRRLAQPLPDLVADVERTIGLDVEVAVAGPEGRAHLDAFADVVDDFAAIGGGVPELLDFLTTAAEREEGLVPGEIEATAGRVQILTVHAAKGLEWEVVAVPHLSCGVFPAGRKTNWLSDAGQLPPDLRGDVADVPALRLPPAGVDQGELVRSLKQHVDDLKDWQTEEERRLAYVAVTRAQRHLLLSGHHWGATGVKPRGASELLEELRAAALAAPDSTEPDSWAAPPADGESNPTTADPRTAEWPRDPLGDRRSAVRAGADAVAAALAAAPPTDTAEQADAEPDDDPHRWATDVTTLLRERRAGRAAVVDVELPGTISVSALVDLAADPGALATAVRRPVPMPPAPQARRGTAFHLWLEHRFAGEALLGLDELPGADDRDAAADDRLEVLQQAFLASPWADRNPLRVEVPFATRIGPVGVRGRIDAVFADQGGGFTVVDWKTGRRPSAAQAEAAAVQLAAYRLAWAELADLPLPQVRAAFHYVADGITLAPVDLLDRAGLTTLVEGALAVPADE